MILDKAPYGVLSTVDGDGVPYGVPLSLARDGEWLYFHCAQEGHKLDNLRVRPRVQALFVGGAETVENQFTLIYESAMVFGAAREVTAPEEKLRGLRVICRRFTPGNMDAFEEYAARLLDKTGVWKIRIEEISGKRRAAAD